MCRAYTEVGAGTPSTTSIVNHVSTHPPFTAIPYRGCAHTGQMEPNRPRRRLPGWAAVVLGATCCTLMLVPSAAAAVTAAQTVREGTPVVRGDWLWPVAFPHPVERPFLAPPRPYAAGHRGVDITATVGSPVLAVADGTVYFVGTVVDRGVLTLEHPGALLSTVEPVTPLVANGDRVRAGQPIAVVASGGHCGDRCVHLGVRLGGQYVSPLLYLGGIPRAVLLPLN